jgi:uncharacterized protein YuzE
MKYEYDSKADILMIRLKKAKPDYGEQNQNIITHFNKSGKAVEIEILDAKKTAKKIFETIFNSKKQKATV